jgi:protein-tyrosine phosphatase
LSGIASGSGLVFNDSLAADLIFVFNKLLHFFKGQPEEVFIPLSDYSLMGADMHSHLIPAIDDGSTDMESTLAMLREFEQLGFKRIITTPHVVTDGYNNSSATILAGRDKVRAAMKANNIQMEFDAAAEYYLDESMYPKIEQKDLLTFGKNYLLIELSYLERQFNVDEMIYRLQIAGYRIVLAHPERYPYYYENDFKTYTSFKDRNVFLQVNLGSLTGKYGKNAKLTAERLIDNNMVDFVGSDLHKVTQFETLRDTLNSKHLHKILHYEKLLNRTLV